MDYGKRRHGLYGILQNEITESLEEIENYEKHPLHKDKTELRRDVYFHR